MDTNEEEKEQTLEEMIAEFNSIEAEFKKEHNVLKEKYGLESREVSESLEDVEINLANVRSLLKVAQMVTTNPDLTSGEIDTSNLTEYDKTTLSELKCEGIL